MRTPLVATLAFLTLVAASAAGAAERLVLLPATGANVPDAELTAATDLLRADLEQTGRFTVELGTTPGGSVAEPSPSDAGSEAQTARADLAVTLRISRLGAAASARLAAYRPDGSLFRSDALTAASPDDLEPVLKRLAQGLATARPAADLADVDTVTDREARPPRRIPAARVWGLRLGSSWLVDRPGGGTGRLAGVGAFWLYDARAFLADVSLDWHGGGGDQLLDGGLGIWLPLGRENVAPYVGGGLGYLIAHTHRETGAGLEVRGAAGLLVGRLHTVQVRAEAGWRMSLFTLKIDGARRAAQGPFATIGIGF